jgi:hypothetical protein
VWIKKYTNECTEPKTCVLICPRVFDRVLPPMITRKGKSGADKRKSDLDGVRKPDKLRKGEYIISGTAGGCGPSEPKTEEKENDPTMKRRM